MCLIQVLLLSFAFRFEDAVRYHNAKQPEHHDNMKETPRHFLRFSVTWICAAYFLTYIGIEGQSSHHTIPSGRHCIRFLEPNFDFNSLYYRLDRRIHDPRSPCSPIPGQHMLFSVRRRHGSRPSITGCYHRKSRCPFGNHWLPDLRYCASGSLRPHRDPSRLSSHHHSAGLLPGTAFPVGHRHDNSTASSRPACESCLVRVVAWPGWRSVAALCYWSHSRDIRYPGLSSRYSWAAGCDTFHLVVFSKTEAI